MKDKDKKKDRIKYKRNTRIKEYSIQKEVAENNQQHFTVNSATYLSAKRKIAEENLRERGYKVDGENNLPILFSCDDCPMIHTCPYAYDEYNVNGDCLVNL